MQKLWSFIVEKKHWFLLLILLAFSLSLFLNDSMYRRGLSLYARSYLSGYINEAMTYGYSYINLAERNQVLLAENARLEQELITIRRRIADAQANQSLPTFLPLDSTGIAPTFVTARIVNMRNEQGEAYYIINRGSRQGIKVDMPVMSSTGVMGTIMEVSNNYSIIIPITNPRMKLSTMVRGKEYKGEVFSLGYNRPTLLGGVPLQAAISKGDTVVTSGYSYIFPEGLMVGRVEEKDTRGVTGAASAFGTFRLKLATDFDKLKYVYVLLTPHTAEAKMLEQTLIEEEE